MKQLFDENHRIRSTATPNSLIKECSRCHNTQWHDPRLVDECGACEDLYCSDCSDRLGNTACDECQKFMGSDCQAIDYCETCDWAFCASCWDAHVEDCERRYRY